MLKGIFKTGLLGALVFGALAFGTADCRPNGLVLQAGTNLEPFEGDVLSRWQVIGGATAFIDSVNTVEGNQALGLQGTPGQFLAVRTYTNLNLSQKHNFSFWVHVDSPTTPEIGPSIAVYMTGNGYASYFLAQSAQMHQGWNQIVLSREDFQNVNGASWDALVTSIQLRVNPAAGSVSGVKVAIDDFDMGETTRPKIIIAFDDSFKTDLTVAFELMTNQGLKGTEYAVSSFVGQTDRLKQRDLNRMYASGWDICNHSATHPHMANMPESQVIGEYLTCQQWLLDSGYVRNDCYRHVAYPYGEYSESVLDAMEALGMLSARTTLVSRQANSFDEPYMMYSVSPMPSQRFAQIKPYIDATIASGGCLQICLHRLVTTPTLSGDWRINDFKQLVEYVSQRQEAGDIDSCTISEWYKLVGKFNHP